MEILSSPHFMISGSWYTGDQNELYLIKMMGSSLNKTLRHFKL